MLKEIKLEREITSLLKRLIKIKGYYGQEHLHYFSLDEVKYIQVNTSPLNKNIVIHYESFPYYNKKVHSMVINYLNDYKIDYVKLFRTSTNSNIKLDELC